MTMNYRKLPVELWDLVVSVSPREVQRSCLAVSKLFHDLALPAVFGELVFHYGMIGYDDSVPTKGEERHKRLRQQCERNQAILKHITTSPTFAHVIKHVVICWYERCFTAEGLDIQLGRSSGFLRC